MQEHPDNQPQDVGVVVFQFNHATGKRPERRHGRKKHHKRPCGPCRQARTQQEAAQDERNRYFMDDNCQEEVVVILQGNPLQEGVYAEPQEQQQGEFPFGFCVDVSVFGPAG